MLPGRRRTFASAFAGLLLSCAAAPESAATSTAASTEEDDVFQRSDPALDLRLTADFSRLFAQDASGLRDEGASVVGTFASPALGVADPLAVIVSVRGNTSLEPSECSFPKLKVKFRDETVLRGTPLEGHGTLRIATHCGERPVEARTDYGRVANEASPWREAFVHQLLRGAGIEAPKARPVAITYTDTGKGSAALTRKAALIETAGDVARRLGGTEPFVVDSEIAVHDPRANDSAEPEQMPLATIARVHFAEALVGNEDFRLMRETETWWFGGEIPSTVSRMWNMKAVRFADGGEVPIPIDFDLSSIVAPRPNDVPPPELWGRTGSARAQFRVLSGARMRFDRGTLDEARRAMATRRAAVEALVGTPWLDDEARRVTTELVASFFRLVTDDQAFYVDVIAPGKDVDYVRADGTPNEACLTTAVPAGTPVHRSGNVNVELGIEEVTLFDPKFQLPCNEATVWIPSGTATTTDYPR